MWPRRRPPSQPWTSRATLAAATGRLSALTSPSPPSRSTSGTSCPMPRYVPRAREMLVLVRVRARVRECVRDSETPFCAGVFPFAHGLRAVLQRMPESNRPHARSRAVYVPCVNCRCALSACYWSMAYYVGTSSRTNAKFCLFHLCAEPQPACASGVAHREQGVHPLISDCLPRNTRHGRYDALVLLARARAIATRHGECMMRWFIAQSPAAALATTASSRMSYDSVVCVRAV